MFIKPSYSRLWQLHEPISPMFIGADGEYSFFHATFK